MIINNDKEVFAQKELHEVNQRRSEYFRKHTFTKWGNKKFYSSSVECTVTLPCCPGRKVWTILEYRRFSGVRAWRISERIVNNVTVFEGGDMQLCLMDPKAYTGELKDGIGHEQTIYWLSDKIGKDLFFSLEDAEEALHERIQQCR